MKETLTEIPEIHKGHWYFGCISHWLAISSCLISLLCPVLILMYPQRNVLNPTLIFNAIFEGKRPAEIWEAAGVPFTSGEFWKIFFYNVFTPDGFALFGIVLGCSAALWALVPAVWQFIKKKEYFNIIISLLVMALISLAMSGIVTIAG